MVFTYEYMMTKGPGFVFCFFFFGLIDLVAFLFHKLNAKASRSMHFHVQVYIMCVSLYLDVFGVIIINLS